MGRAQLASFGVMTAAIAALAAPRWEPPPPLSNVMVWISPSTLRSRYGIELQHVGVLASGRLVELRFKVLAPARAKQLFELAPALRTGDGVLLQASEAWRRARPTDDGSCSVMFPNEGGAIEPGSRVSLAIGGQRSQPMVAK